MHAKAAAAVESVVALLENASKQSEQEPTPLAARDAIIIPGIISPSLGSIIILAKLFFSRVIVVGSSCYCKECNNIYEPAIRATICHYLFVYGCLSDSKEWSLVCVACTLRNHSGSLTRRLIFNYTISLPFVV